MIYFARKGDAKMCLYLVSRGASTTKTSDKNYCEFYPMYQAAQNGHLDVCKVLYENGAENDVRRTNTRRVRRTIITRRNYLTPFRAASINGHDQVARWLVLHGALCADSNSEDVDVERILKEVQEARNSGPSQQGLR